jgi:hypothetical protein
VLTPTSTPTATHTPTITPTPTISAYVRDVLQPGRVLEHPPTDENPYYFYTYFPRSALYRQEIVLLVWAHGGGRASDDYEDHKAQAQVKFSWLKEHVDRLGMPLLVVAVPRPKYQGGYITTLVPETFTSSNDMFYRPDLKLIHAVWDQYIPSMQQAGYQVDSQVFMMGFSSVSTFTLRFTILHPERIKAAWLGGSATSPIPAETYVGTTINYPVGIAGLEALSGQPFNLEAYQEVPHFIAIGEEDTNPQNDTTRFRECYSLSDAEFIRTHFGDTKPARAEFFYDYLLSIGVPAEFKSYPGVGHKLTDQMLAHAFDFFARFMEP